MRKLGKKTVRGPNMAHRANELPHAAPSSLNALPERNTQSLKMKVKRYVCVKREKRKRKKNAKAAAATTHVFSNYVSDCESRHWSLAWQGPASNFPWLSRTLDAASVAWAGHLHHQHQLLALAAGRHRS